MKTVTLKMEDKIYDKFYWFLEHFKSSEIEILENTTYVNDDEYLRSIKGLEQSIIDESNKPIEKYVTIDKLDW